MKRRPEQNQENIIKVPSDKRTTCQASCLKVGTWAEIDGAWYCACWDYKTEELVFMDTKMNIRTFGVGTRATRLGFANIQVVPYAEG